MTAYQEATAAIDRAAVPRVQRAGNITYFKRLNPKEFSGNEKPLAADSGCWMSLTFSKEQTSRKKIR